MLVWLLTYPALALANDFVHVLPWKDYLIYSLSSIFLVLFAGLMSGLTVGLLSIDVLDLEMKLANGSPDEQHRARKILSIISDRHTLLVTLLVANAVAMETLPICLDTMFGSVLAIIISVSFVLIFGEILPQAICTGPDQLTIAYKLVPLVNCVVVLFFPISWPIARLLDRILGKHSVYKKYRPEDLKALVELHGIDTNDDSCLSPSQIQIIHGAIDLEKKQAKDYMIKLEYLYMLEVKTLLTASKMTEIIDSGYSRVPIYQGKRSNIVGILLTKRLLGVQTGSLVNDLKQLLRRPLILSHSVMLLDVLNYFEDTGTYIAFLTNQYDQVVGAITLKDTLSHVLNTYILNEDEFERSTCIENGSLGHLKKDMTFDEDSDLHNLAKC